MKRAIVLAVLLIASQADARTLVIARKHAPVGVVSDYVAKQSGERFETLVTDLLNKVTGGVSDTTYGYTVVRDDQVNTEEARSGLRVLNRGQSGARGVQYDAVLWLGPTISSLGAGRVRADSLFIANSALPRGGGPRVPQCFLFSDEIPNVGLGSLVSCPKCSTGVSDPTATALSGVATGELFQQTGKARGWYTAGLYTSGMVHSSDRDPLGGFRSLVEMKQSALDLYNYTGVVPAWRDSAWTWARVDTMALWELPSSGFAASLGASASVFCYPDGNGGPGDSLTDNGGGVTGDPFEKRAAEVDPALILVALARLDSLSSHRVFDPRKLPIKLAVTVDGAFMRTTHMPGPGIRPQDSTFVKATFDSIAKINAAGGVPIRLTVGVNVDSMTQTQYRSELSWWRKVPGTRFSPQPWRGVKTTVGGVNGDGAADPAGASGAVNIPDMLGFRRSRAFSSDGTAFTAGGIGNADTSICALMEGARAQMVAAGIRSEEMSHTLLPALDDWSPANREGVANRDSFFLVCRTCGGFSTIRAAGTPKQSDPQSYSAAASATFRGVSNGSMGYGNREGRYRDTNGGYVTVLAEGPRQILGSYRAVATIDSLVYPLSSFYDPLFATLYTTWAGLTRTREYMQGDYRSDYPQDFGGFAFDSIGTTAAVQAVGGHPDNYYVTVKNNWLDHSIWDGWPGSAHVLALTMADLSGHSGGVEANGSRNGYWILKSLKNQFDAINDFAGKTVIQFDYPENIRP